MKTSDCTSKIPFRICNDKCCLQRQHFQEGVPEGVFDILGDHTCQPLFEGLLQVAGEESLAVSQTSDSRGVMWFLSWPWNTRISSIPCE